MIFEIQKAGATAMIKDDIPGNNLVSTIRNMFLLVIVSLLVMFVGMVDDANAEEPKKETSPQIEEIGRFGKSDSLKTLYRLTDGKRVCYIIETTDWRASTPATISCVPVEKSE